MDATGRVDWSPLTADIGVYSFTARVTDAYGGTATRPVNLEVIADTADPSVSIRSSNSSPLVGDTITLQVFAQDATGIMTS